MSNGGILHFIGDNPGVLERPSDKAKGSLARIADRMGITYDRLLKNTAYRAAALEQALKDPEVAKEVMANVTPE